MSLPHVDHMPPRQAFRAALKGQLPRVFTVHAMSGKGKSRLIGSFRQECKDYGIPVVLLDFKSLHGRDVFDILGLVRFYFRTLSFPAYDVSVTEYLNAPSSSVTLKDIYLTASNLSDITAGDPQRRHVVLGHLTDTLLHDLEDDCVKYCAVLLVDTFEQADHDIKTWITGQVIPSVCDLPGLVTVIAGQETPQIDPALWQGIYRHFELPVGLTLDDWLEYAKAVGALGTLTENTLKRYHIHYQGDPSFMCEICDPFLAEAL